jgi:antibiotic biosynthesis monooxygenase (ABM) superfamily enzyme
MAKDEKEGKIITDGKAVTVVVSRQVFTGKEKEYNDLARQMIDEAAKIPGNLGVTILAPEPGKGGLHHLIWRFADEKSMHLWETSYVRQKLSHEADAFSRRIRQEATGLETWFAIPECPELETPPPWKMAIVTWMGVFLLSCLIIYLLDLFWKVPNFWVFNAVVGAILVTLLTWVVMPIFSRYIFRKWLYKQ